MSDIASCIHTLNNLCKSNIPTNLLPLIKDVITALEDTDIDKIVFGFDELICHYCIELIDAMNIQCPNVMSMFPIQKYWLAKKQNLLAADLYSIWEKTFYVSSALCTCLDFGDSLSEERIQEAFDCIHKFSNYLIEKSS